MSSGRSRAVPRPLGSMSTRVGVPSGHSDVIVIEKLLGSPIPQAHVRIVGVLLLVTAGTALAVAPARFVRFSEARPILTELVGRLPRELNTLNPAQLETAWPGWIE